MALTWPWMLFLCAVGSAQYTPDLTDSRYNISAVQENANVTKLFPFNIGDDEWNLRVQISEAIGRGPNATDVEDPRVVMTFYNLQPPASWSSTNPTGLPVPYDVGDPDSAYRYGSVVTYWPFSTQATNAYDVDRPGSCYGVVGEGCIQEIQAQNFRNFSLSESQQCQDVSSRVTDASYAGFSIPSSYLNGTVTLSLTSYTSEIYPARNRTLYDRELQRVHLAIVWGDEASIVCGRVNTDQLQESDPGTSPAPSSSGGLLPPCAWMIVAMTTLVYSL